MADEPKVPGIYVASSVCWKGNVTHSRLAAKFGPNEKAAQDASIAALFREKPIGEKYVNHDYWLWFRVPDEVVEEAYKDLVARREAARLAKEAEERAKAAAGGLSLSEPNEKIGALSVVPAGREVKS